MKKTNNWIVRLVALLTVSFTLATFVSVAAGSGSSTDPLVTLSYLNDVYADKLLGEVDAKIAERDKALRRDMGIEDSGTSAAESSFVLVTLAKDETLGVELGGEMLLRVGSASCVAGSEPGLIDTTDGGTLPGGRDLTRNHLYMVTMTDRGAKATTDTVKILVRGAYTVS